MGHRLGLLAVMAGLLWSSGCAMCCAPYDDHYPYTGGRWVRDNPTHGRVGSAFEPAGHRVEGAETQAPGPVADEDGESILPRRDGASYLPMAE
jgi:hypothetical protein